VVRGMRLRPRRGRLQLTAVSWGPADPETVAWWEAVMTPPQVAFGARTPVESRELAAARPDFLGLPPALWMGQGDAAAALRGLLSALAEDA